MDPKLTQCIPNHHKTPVFHQFYSSEYTHYVLMIFTAQFKAPPIVDVLGALFSKKQKKFKFFQKKGSEDIY